MVMPDLVAQALQVKGIMVLLPIKVAHPMAVAVVVRVQQAAVRQVADMVRAFERLL